MNTKDVKLKGIEQKLKSHGLLDSYFFIKKCIKEPRYAVRLKTLCEYAGLDTSTFSPYVKKILCKIVRQVGVINKNYVKGAVVVLNYYDRNDDKDAEWIMNHGALCLITDHQIANYPCIIVDFPEKTAALMGRYYRDLRPKLKATAIIGSIGKTSVTSMINCVYSTQYNNFYCHSNSNEWGDAMYYVQHLMKNNETMIQECSEDELIYSPLYTTILDPKIAVITPITNSHFMRLKSFENTVDSVCSITKGMSKDGVVIVNSDDFTWFDKLNGLKTITVSISNKEADYSAQNIVIDTKGTSFEVVDKANKSTYKAFLQNNFAKHNVANALLAFAAGVASGVTVENIITGLATYKATGIRQNIFRTENNVTVYADCYNATELSIKSAIEASGNIPVVEGGRRFIVLGDVSETGTLNEEIHNNICRLVDESNYDVFIGKGEFISEAIEKYHFKRHLTIKHYITNEEVATYLKENVIGNDLVLFKGSRSNYLENIIKILWSQDYDTYILKPDMRSWSWARKIAKQ